MSVFESGTVLRVPAVVDPLPQEVASFGDVELEVTDLGRSTAFWTEVIGLVVRTEDATVVELGTQSDTLVTLRGGAGAGFQQRHSGLYHLAIHPPTEPDFARVLLRIARAGWAASPTDHIMSKAIYLLDPDGITVEITLETPQRMREFVVSEQGMNVITADGRATDGRDPLDIEAVLDTLDTYDHTIVLPVGTKVGHVHLYVGDLQAAYDFYEKLGFNQAVWAPRFHLGDLGAGGRFNHRIAMNMWQGVGAPQAPEGTARMRHFTIRLDTHERLDSTLGALNDLSELDGGYLTRDPSGNPILLAS